MKTELENAPMVYVVYSPCGCIRFAGLGKKRPGLKDDIIEEVVKAIDEDLKIGCIPAEEARTGSWACDKCGKRKATK